jgi:iron complex transport system substrate-binding protein
MRWAAAFILALGVAHARVEVHDDYGHTVSLAAPAQRIVSLAPHLTELLYAAGAGGRVVGALEHSDFPPAAAKLPRVGSEAAIDLEAVIALRPDLVVAWPNAGSRRAVERLAELPLAVFRSEPRALDQIATTLERFGILAGTESEARRAAHVFRQRVRALEARYAGRRAVRVFYQVWDRPLVTVNGEHIISKAMELCGGKNVFARLPLIAPEVDREAVIRADPEVIVASGAALEAWKAFGGISAVKNDQLYSIAAELLQRHTPRLIDGAEQLCAALERARARS